VGGREELVGGTIDGAGIEQSCWQLSGFHFLACSLIN